MDDDADVRDSLEMLLRQHRLKPCPLVIIGLGKLGGRELTYGSDLDIALVAPPGAKNLPQFQRLAAELIDWLSQPTEEGPRHATQPG